MSLYVPKPNVKHTNNGQGTAISTLDHLATTPRAFGSLCFRGHFEKFGNAKEFSHIQWHNGGNIHYSQIFFWNNYVLC